MPATYRKRGKGSADYVSKAWAPAPQQPPKPKQYFILGMEVDYNTYREYSYEKKWTIDGDVLKGFTATLWSLERYATEEHAKDCPIEAANARKILDQIREEIKTITGKDDKAMSNPKTASDFLRELQTIYTESRAAFDAMQKKMDAAKVKLDLAYEELRDPACANRQLAEARYSVAKGEYQLAEDEHRHDHSYMMQEHQKKVAELRGQLSAYLDEHYAANPDKIDAATMQLLNSGICTASDLARLAERYTDNPTMLRIVGSHAANKMQEDKHLSREDRVTCAVVKNKASSADGGNEMSLFEEAVSVANYGLGKDYAHATFMHNTIVTDALEGYRQRLDASNAGTAEE